MSLTLNLDHPLSEVHRRIIEDSRYSAGFRYGVPRKGHPEGTVGNHLLDLKINLATMGNYGDINLSEDESWKLLILIEVHDIMKYAAKPDSPIIDPQSHASLAKAFLSEFVDDEDLLNIVQAHDENLALWQQQKAKGKYSDERLKERVLDKIKDIELLLLFQILDAYTPGKTDMREMPRWFVDQVHKHRPVPRIYRALELFGL